MIYWQLFCSFFQVGLFTVGGGYASLPLIQDRIVDTHGWLTMAQFTDIITIAEMTPGPIAINAATFAGIQVAGLWGGVAATAGSVTPSCIIVTFLAWFYYRYRNLDMVKGILGGMRPGTTALIASAGLTILVLSLFGQRSLPTDLGSVNPLSIVIFLGAFAALRKWKPGPMLTIACCGAAGLILYSLPL